MRAEAHISVARADVRDAGLSKHAAQRFDSGRTFALATGIGFPRLWSMAVDSALAGFGNSLTASGLTGPERLREAYRAARETLAERCDTLIEKQLPDCHFTCVMLDTGDLHVLNAGSGRVYLSRKGQPQRLTPRTADTDLDGILRGDAAESTTPLEPKDIVLAGSASSFSVRSIARLASVLEADPNTPPSVLASLLTEPAARAGVGAAAVVFRIK